ncbi:MAG: phosphatidylserine decarboxylase, partial [Bradyrhizobium sp.]|nr:phosphatidylserine decarboxylase [Bradyrhizobium sp.]
TERPLAYSCNNVVRKGDELGWFEHGSTIILLAPGDFTFCPEIAEGARIRAGQPLWRRRVAAEGM